MCGKREDHQCEECESVFRQTKREFLCAVDSLLKMKPQAPAKPSCEVTTKALEETRKCVHRAMFGRRESGIPKSQPLKTFQN